jgi:hypothetical protein
MGVHKPFSVLECQVVPVHTFLTHCIVFYADTIPGMIVYVIIFVVVVGGGGSGGGGGGGGAAAVVIVVSPLHYLLVDF